MARPLYLRALFLSILILVLAMRSSFAQTLALKDTFQRPDTVAGPANSTSGVTPPPAPPGTTYTDLSGDGWHLKNHQLRDDVPGFPCFLALSDNINILNQEVSIQNVATYPTANLCFGASLRRKDDGTYYYLYWSAGTSQPGFGIARRIGYGSHIPLSLTQTGTANPLPGHNYELRCSAVNAPDNLSVTLTITLYDLTSKSVRGSATTIDGSPSLLTANPVAIANGTTQTPANLVISQIQVFDLGQAKAGGSATGLSFAGPVSGPALAASSPFIVAPFPVGRSVNPGTTITPSDGGAGGLFTPPTLTLSGMTPVLFTYTPPSNGSITAVTRLLTVTSNANLAIPPPLTYVALQILQTGPITTLGVGDGTVRLSASPFYGQKPYTYQWYRSPSMNFPINASTLLANARESVLKDTGLTNGEVYFYILQVRDKTGTIAQSSAYPVIPAKPLVVGFCGDSLTAGAANSGDPPAPTSFARWLQVLTGNVYLPTIPDLSGPNFLNQGHAGSTTGNWLPTDTVTETTPGNLATNYFNRSVTAFKAAQASYVEVMLGNQRQRFRHTVSKRDPGDSQWIPCRRISCGFECAALSSLRSHAKYRIGAIFAGSGLSGDELCREQPWPGFRRRP